MEKRFIPHPRLISLLCVGVVCLVLLGAAGSAAAAIGLDAASSNTVTSSSSITISHATGNGADRLMLVGVSMTDGSGTRQISSVTYDGTNLTFVGGRRDAPGNTVRCEIWRLTSPPSGTANVVVTLNGNSEGIVAGVVTFTGVDQTTPLGSFNSAQGISRTPSVTLSSASGELVFDTVAFREGQSLNVGANQTQQWWMADGANKVIGAGSTEPGAASVTMSWSQTGGGAKEWVIGAVPIIALTPTSTCAVTTTADSGPGSLRQCINYANSNPGTTISFNIPGPGNQSSGGDSWWRISPASVLPTITANGTIIDGTTQTTNQGNTNTLGPEIEIDGSLIAPVSSQGFFLSSSNNRIKGFIINNFNTAASAAVRIAGASASSNVVTGCYLGTNYSGTAVIGNTLGMYLHNGASSNTIGGTTDPERNVISGNSQYGIRIDDIGSNNNTIMGNYIGTDSTGTSAFNVGTGGVYIYGGPQSNTIGGDTADRRNIISGQNGPGVGISDANLNIVKGNYIGTDVNGLVSLRNNTAGVYLSMNTTSNTIGGSTAGQGNLISGNTGYGVMITAIAGGANSNIVKGNRIGTGAGGTTALPNTSNGIQLMNGVQSNVIGGTGANEGNVIAFNGGDGVYLDGATTDRNIISGNAIFSNTGLGIDIAPDGVGTGSGANNNKARPILSIAANGSNSDVTATVTSGDTVEFFRVNNSGSPPVSGDPTGSGEGYLYLGKCVDNGPCSGPYMVSATDANGAGGTVLATLSSFGLSENDGVTATATDAANGTSEFSVNVLVPSPACTSYETPVYKACIAKGRIRELYLKQTSSPTTNVQNGDILYSFGYGDTAGVIGIWNDAASTSTVTLNNSAVIRIQQSGYLKNGGGTSYGTSTSILSLYRDRFVIDTSSSISSGLGTSPKLFCESTHWAQPAAGTTYRYCNGTPCGAVNSRTLPPVGTASYTSPFTFQVFNELGATDGLATVVTRDLNSTFTTATRDDGYSAGVYMMIDSYQASPAIGTTYRMGALFNFDAGTGFSNSLTQQHNNDYGTPATLDFTGGDGTVVGSGFAAQRDAYTLDDGDADDHVLFTFQVGSYTPRFTPVFEITNWNTSAPSTILVNGAAKNINTDYVAAVSGTTLYMQYLSNLSANTVFEIPPLCPGGVVTATADTGAGSLRECINYANGNPGTTIRFNIAGCPGGLCTISPASGLPAITANGTIIDGYTQTGAQANTVAAPGASNAALKIEISGNSSGGAYAFTLQSMNNLIRGLVINGGWSLGIGVDNSNNTISGNYFGTNIAGTAASATRLETAMYISKGSNTVGGAGVGDRNLISGTSSNSIWLLTPTAQSNQILNNYIGTNVNGTSAIANPNAIVFTDGASSNTVQGNLISGNTTGIWIEKNTANTPNLNVIKGNKIGTDINGTSTVPNGTGIRIFNGATNTTIGGTAAGERNIISGNSSYGLYFAGAGTSGNSVKGNYIGTDINGTAALANGYGIYLDTGPSSNTIGGEISGEGNRIGFNTNSGVYLTGASTDNNAISGNSIFSNGGLGIDIAPAGVGTGSGANNNKARPTITGIVPNGANFDITATVISGDTIEFFRVNNAASPAVTPDPSGSGEGYLYLGRCVDNGPCSGPYILGAADANAAAGTVRITLTSGGVTGSDSVTATATDATNGTSEFAANVTVTALVYQPDAMIKLSTEGAGAYATDNVYEAAAATQVKSQGVVSGSTAAYNLFFQNDGNVSDNLAITQAAADNCAGFTVQYLDNTSTDRTASVTGGGYTIAGMAAGAGTTWTLRVTPPGTINGGSPACGVSVTATSAGNGTKVDQVRANTSSTSANLTLLKSADRATVAPGQDIMYTVNALNGAGLTPASAVIVTDPIPAYTGFKVGSATFSPGTSTLSLSGGAPSFSNDNGATWTYNPVSGNCSAPAGYDFCVTNVRWTTTGTMPPGTSFSLTFVVRVK